MCRGLLIVVLFAGLAPQALGQPAANEQLDRRDRREPAIVLNTGGRTGTCDVLKFTPDGSELLGAGDDKVVTAYRVDDKGLDNSRVRFLRWPTWREQRGSIFAMDISPDGRHVAIGGYGLLNSAVAILERGSGKIVKIANLERERENFFAVMAVAFSSSGKQLTIGTGNGYVWVWDLAGDPTVVGRHKQFEGTTFNRVRAVRFADENTITSIAEDGKVARWTRAPGAWHGALELDLKVKNAVRTAAFSAQGWIAAGELGTSLHVSSPDGSVKHVVTLKENEFSRSLTFDSTGSQLAVGIGRLLDSQTFQLEGDDRITLFDIARKEPRVISQLLHTGRAEALAWKDNRLGVAGGDNHEVALWDLRHPEKPLSVARGQCSGLWGVALSEDGRYLAFNDHRDRRPAHPNRRGTGDERYFDLSRRRFERERPADVKFVRAVDGVAGWTVRPHASLPWQWIVVDSANREYPLPWDRDLDGRPTCWTFLKPSDGKPLRLAVGHYWGFSLFELGDNGFQRTRLYTGHHGEVTAIAAAANGQWIVTASADQTLAAYSLRDWPSKTALGAKFTAGPATVRVDAVDASSPAWEMGLTTGDEIVLLAIGGREVFVEGKLGTAAQAKQSLDTAKLGVEVAVYIKRAGRQKLLYSPSFIRTRPLWRMLPGPRRDWVLWMWQGSFYDTMTSGDSLAGFLINDPSMKREPRFYKLEQFRKQFERPSLINKLLTLRDAGKALELALGDNPVPINLGLSEPPEARIELPTDVANGPITATLLATPRGDNVDFQPRRVELWINDYRAKSWDAGGQPFKQLFEITPTMLRSGSNQLTLQVFNQLGGRSEVTRTLANPKQAESRQLLSVGVGVNDYSSSIISPTRDRFGNLRGAVNDVTMLAQRWAAQKGKLFADSPVILKPNKAANRNGVLAELDRIAKEARPDDVLLLFLSGHGHFHEAPGAKPEEVISRFYFCCPDFNYATPDGTGIDHETLYEKLASIRCRKVVFLDACHAGEAAFNPIRSLTPGGQGPTILAACSRTEQAHEHPEKPNGVFTLAVLKALGDAASDRSGDGTLDAAELFEAVERELPAMLRDSGLGKARQNPQLFPAQPESFPLFRR